MSSLFGGGGTTQTVQNSSPWGPSQSNLQDIFNKGSDQYYRNYYNGGVTPGMQQATDLQRNRGLMGSPQTDAANQQNLSTINGDYLDLSKNPGVKSAMDMARTGINAQFSGDNFGNSAHQEWLGKGLLNAAAPFYQNERGLQQQAIGMAPTLANQDYTDIANVAGANQTIDQAPWQNLFNYQQAMGGVGGGTTTAQQPYYTNPLGSALGGAAGGSLLGPWGAAAGGLLGLFGSKH